MLPSPHIAIMQSPPGPETVIDGRRYLYFGGTSYLGLAGHPEVIEAACEATRRYGIHTATSRSGFGNSPATLEVERLAAAFFGLDAAFYFSSGYVANHILVPALARTADIAFLDEAAHYCVEEAAKLSGLPVVRFRHRDPGDLEQLLERHLRSGQRPLVLSDGVFPMTGAIAPIPDYLRVLAHYPRSALAIDDAHGLGVLGDHGRGALEHLGLWSPKVNAALAAEETGLFVVGTLAKALGGFGGIIPGTHEFLNGVRAASHYYDGASAPPSAAAGASAKALAIVRREPGFRDQLRANTRQLRQGLRALGLAVEDWPTPNVGVQIGDRANMQRLHLALKERGILVPYVGTYSGIGAEGLLRFAVCATHSAGMVDRLLDELRVLL